MIPSTTIRRQRRWLSRTAYYGSRFCFHWEQPQLLSSTLADDPDIRFRWANQSRRLGGATIPRVTICTLTQPQTWRGRDMNSDDKVARPQTWRAVNKTSQTNLYLRRTAQTWSQRWELHPLFLGYEPSVKLFHSAAKKLGASSQALPTGISGQPRILTYTMLAFGCRAGTRTQNTALSERFDNHFQHPPMVRLPRIGLGTQPWQGCTLPLRHNRIAVCASQGYEPCRPSPDGSLGIYLGGHTVYESASTW